MRRATAEGFVQLAILDVVGEQFYLAWHCRYNDCTPVCSVDQLRTLPLDKSRAVARIDPVPVVVFSDKTVRVDMLVFTKWGGLRKEKRVFTRVSPHTLISKTVTTVVRYDCGILF